jgi:hypothetical protein
VYNVHRNTICTDKHYRLGNRLVERIYRNQRLHSGKNKTNGKDTKGVKNGQACEASHRKSTYYNTKPSFFSIEASKLFKNPKSTKPSFLSIESSKLFKNPKPNQNNPWYHLQTKNPFMQKQSSQRPPLRWPHKKQYNRQHKPKPQNEYTRNSHTRLLQQPLSMNNLPSPRQSEEHHEDTYSQVNTIPKIYEKKYLLILCFFL